MKFVVSSTELLNHLQSINRVINPKNTLPILDNFLFNLEDDNLEVTASDLETTLITEMQLENTEENGSIAIPARILTDTLKEFPEQPLTFDINLDTFTVVINSENGQYTIVGQDGGDFPQLPEIKESKINIQMEGEVLQKCIGKTIFATSEDELRPVMNGVFFEINKDNLTCVASDAQKLVKYQRTDIKSENESAFILPKKPANLLRGILPKEKNQVVVEFDDKNAVFTLTGYKMVCRLAEGQYPSYNSVIPTDNPNKLTIDRQDLLNALRRVSVYSNQASNLVKLEIQGNQVTASAQDIDYSISAYERLNCQYEGEDMEIGFKSTFMIEILSNLSSNEVFLEMSDPSRAGIFLPVEKDDDNEEVLMLLMPMMTGSA
jgi:DNA polymerase-3 subunit beta